MDKVVIVAGPTASGKTSLAVELAKQLNGEVISADSMQIYKHLRIGTARPTEDEMQGVAHHLLAFVEPDANYSVADYQRDAFSVINDVLSRGRVPIVAGGTGLYINSLVYKLDFSTAKSDPELRKYFSKMYDENGPDYMHNLLAKKDKKAAERIHKNDKTRIVRRLEMIELGADDSFEFRKPNKDFDFKMFLLDMPREVLYQRIDLRVDDMMREGLEAEVRSLYQNFGFEISAFKAIGYKELLPYLANEVNLEQIVSQIKQNTRRYAKRQLTWFKRDERYFRLDALSNDIVEQALKVI